MAERAHMTADLIGMSNANPLTRRTFMNSAAAAAAGYTLAAGPVCADTIKTGTSGIDVATEKIKVVAGDMPVYVARPQTVKNPPVVLVAMEVFGLHEYIKDVARRLAKLGALAMAPDYYFKQGDLSQFTDIGKLMPLVNSKPDDELVADLDSCVAWAGKNGGDAKRVGIVGFCRGGRTVWVYCARSAAPKAGVAFYGSLADPPAQKAVWPKSPIELAPEMKAPVLGLYGGADQGITADQIETMKKALAAAGKTAEFKIYPDAPHGFMPTTGRATGRPPPRRPGRRCKLGSRPTAFWRESPGLHDPNICKIAATRPGVSRRVSKCLTLISSPRGRRRSKRDPGFHRYFSSCMTSACPRFEAISRACSRFLLRRLRSAPASIKAWTTPAWPASAASMSAVNPS